MSEVRHRSWDGGFDDVAFRLGPMAAFAAVAAACVVAGPRWTSAAAPWPWIVSLVFVGLPHGAADLALTRRLTRGPADVAAFFGGYVLVMAAVVCGFALAPQATLLAFVALSGWHFGAAHADSQGPQPAIPRLRLPLSAVARGAAVVGIPLLVWPEASAAVGGDLVRLAGSAAALDPGSVRGLGTGLCLAAAVALAWEAWSSRGDPSAAARFRATLGDLAVIGAVEAVADPLFAVGCYFLGWHAWRQMRLLAPAISGGSIAGPRQLGRALGRIHAAALPLLVPTWLAIAAAWWLLPPTALTRDARGLAILSLAVYVVVTPSHDLLVDWWRRAGAARRLSACVPRRRASPPVRPSRPS